MKALLLISNSLKYCKATQFFVHCKIHDFETIEPVIHLSGMNVTTTLVVLQCQLAQVDLHSQLSTYMRIYIVCTALYS